MAEVIAREFVEQAGMTVELWSAGTYVRPGDTATPEARLMATEHSLDLSDHRARQLTPELATTVDLVISMTERHAARAAWLGAKGVVVMSPAIPNPIGRGVEEYRRAWDALAAHVPRTLRESQPEPACDAVIAGHCEHPLSWPLALPRLGT